MGKNYIERFGEQKANEIKDKISKGNKGKGHSQTLESRKKISETMKSLKGKVGGYKRGSGRGKKGWYKNFWCDSSYELAYVIYNLEHNILFKRNTEKFSYSFNGMEKFWIPDFILQDDTYVEIKGYLTEQTMEKLRFFKKPINLLMQKDLKYIFEYVISKYGKNYIEQYEGYKKPEKIKKKRMTKEKKKYYCKSCFVEISRNSKSGECSNCVKIKNRKIINRPTIEVLLKEIKETNFLAVGRKYGVSDNAIRKWIKSKERCVSGLNGKS